MIEGSMMIQSNAAGTLIMLHSGIHNPRLLLSVTMKS